MDDRLESLADRLDAIAAEIAETAIDELKSALRSGAGKPPAAERRLTQARRAVEKAAHLLRSIDAGSGDDVDDPGSAQFD